MQPLGTRLYLSYITHAQVSKAANRVECEIGLSSDLVSGYGEFSFFAQEFSYGDGHLEGCRNVGVEGFVNVRSISRFCECDLL